MQRCISKLRALSQSLPIFTSSHRSILHSSSQFTVNNSLLFKPSFIVPFKTQHITLEFGFQSSFAPSPLLNQCRGFSSSSKERRLKRLTPVKSKVKKIKMKSYSSFKSRFRIMSDGQIRRWHAGKRHNAHLKSKKAKRRLRQPDVVHPAYAKVMKKLNFCG